MGKAPDYISLAADLRETLARCQAGNITLSRKKVEVGSKNQYAGFIVSQDGCFPDPAKVLTLKEFLEPQDIHGLRVFLGKTQQMTSLLPNLSHPRESC